VGTGSLFGVKQPGRGVDHTPLSRAEVEGSVELYICSLSLSLSLSLSGSLWPVLGRTAFLLYVYIKRGQKLLSIIRGKYDNLNQTENIHYVRFI
jgi:hypothetical protein